MRIPTYAVNLSILATAIGLVGSLVLPGCRSLPPSKPEAMWTTEEARGAQVFQQK